MTDEDRIEKEIENLSQTIDSWEDTDPLYMDDSVRALRHRVMYVHTRLESSVGLLLGDYVLSSAKNTIEKRTRQIIMTKFDKVVSEIDFAKKVTLAEELNLISGDIKAKLFQVNRFRIIFSHPKAHEAEIIEFQDRENYLKVLKQLRDAYGAMNNFFSKYNK